MLLTTVLTPYRTVLAVLAAAACVSCGGSSSGSDGKAAQVGSLGRGDESGVLCTPSDTQGRVSDGFNALTNSGSTEVEITSVELEDASNLTLDSSYLLPTEGKPLLGAFPGQFPAPDTEVTDSRWTARQKAVGTQLASGEAGRRGLLLEVTLADLGRPGTAKGVVVRYRQGGDSFTWRSIVERHVPAAGGSCP